MLVPNSPGAKLSCVKLSVAKLSYHLFDYQSSMTLSKCFQFVKNHHYSLVLECHRSPLLVLFAEVIVNGLCVMRFRLNSINFLQSEEKGSVWRRKILGKRQKQRRWIFFLAEADLAGTNWKTLILLFRKCETTPIVTKKF